MHIKLNENWKTHLGSHLIGKLVCGQSHHIASHTRERLLKGDNKQEVRNLYVRSVIFAIVLSRLAVSEYRLSVR